MNFLKIRRKGEDTHHYETETIPPLARDQLGVSDKAALRINQLIKQQSDASYLRVAIRGGGCSGLSIHYEWAHELRSNDVVFSNAHASVIIDKKSLNILGGATLDVREQHGSLEFVLVNNPAAKQCSCGQSFSL